MEKKLTYNSMFTLKKICVRRVAVFLWSKPDILHSYNKFKVEEKVQDFVPKLQLPPLLTEQVKYIVKQIAFDVLSYRRFLKQYLSILNEHFDIIILEHLCFTVLGTVDYKKMTEKIIRLEMFDCVKNYKLACIFCLEDCISVLWRKLPEVNKKAFYREKYLHNLYVQPALEVCWPFVIRGEEAKLDNMAQRKIGILATFNQYAFEYAAHRGNKTATEYFFHKLTNDEKEVSLFRAIQAVLRHRLENYERFNEENFPPEKLSETTFYLLSQMSQEKQMEIFKMYPCNIFMCLLDWPWQELFWDMADIMWSFLLETDNDHLLKIVANRITSHHSFSKLFQEFFLLSPRNFKKRFVDRVWQLGVFSEFFRNEDLETVKVILRNVDSFDKKRLICSEQVFKYFYYLILSNKLIFFGQCLQEAMLSKIDKDELKEVYYGYLTRIDNRDIDRRNKMWERFLQVID